MAVCNTDGSWSCECLKGWRPICPEQIAIGEAMLKIMLRCGYCVMPLGGDIHHVYQRPVRP